MSGGSRARLAVLAWSAAVVLLPAAARADALAGRWSLNRARSHYAPGTPPRKHEVLDCTARAAQLKCTLRSVRADGKTLVGTFAAAYDGREYPAQGFPEVDRVALRAVDESVADATFSYQGQPVFAYRAIRSRDGRQLLLVSVDPVTRVVQRSVVVYDRLSGSRQQ